MDQHAEPSGGGSFLAWRRRHSVPLGTPCYNCGTALAGAWCHMCGQAATDYHRHAHHLIFEAFESLFHADGRFVRTLPRLVTDPAGLTRDYLAGKRAAQIPPMRLLLVTLLIVFLIGGWTGGTGGAIGVHSDGTPEDKAELAKLQNDINIDVGGLPPGWNAAITTWVRVHVARAIANPERLAEGMGEKAHDFAFLMLPISALILALVFIGRRGFVLFDHFVFSMHSLSFQGLLISTLLIGKMFIPESWLLLAASPVHLFVHMKGVYGCGTSGTLARMAVLFMLSAVAFGLLLAALVIVGLQGLRA